MAQSEKSETPDLFPSFRAIFGNSDPANGDGPRPPQTGTHFADLLPDGRFHWFTSFDIDLRAKSGYFCEISADLSEFLLRIW